MKTECGPPRGGVASHRKAAPDEVVARRHSPCRARRNFGQRLVVLMPEVSHGLEATGGVNIRLVGWNGGRRRPDKAGDSADCYRSTTSGRAEWRGSCSNTPTRCTASSVVRSIASLT
jgi:hypothetical protein